MGQDRATIGWMIAGALLLAGVACDSAWASFDINVQNSACGQPGLKMRGPGAEGAATAEAGVCSTTSEPSSEAGKKAHPAERAVGNDTRISEKDLGAKSPAGDARAAAPDRPAAARRSEVAVEGYVGSSYVYGTLSSSNQGVLEGYLMRPNGGRFYVYGFPEPSATGRVGAYDMSGNLITLQIIADQ